MKCALTPKEMMRLEAAAIASGSSEIDFMEAAGAAVAHSALEILSLLKESPRVGLLVGSGNNGGDALVAGCHLLQEGHSVVAWLAKPPEECKPLVKGYLKSFVELGGKWKCEELIGTSLQQCDLLIDGLLGTGFEGSPHGKVAELIAAANQSGLPIVAVDLPSGVNGETGTTEGEAITAFKTVALEYVKVGCLLQNTREHVGELTTVSFGLPESIKEQARPAMQILDAKIAQMYLVPPQMGDKYTRGYVVTWAGSAGMEGAAYLSGLAALRAGAGIVRLLLPETLSPGAPPAPYELVREFYSSECDCAEGTIKHALDSNCALVIGPGLGRSPQTHALLKKILPTLNNRPLLIDADGLNFLAEQEIPPPKGSVLTPHLGELGRLLGIDRPKGMDQALIERCQSFCETFEGTLLVKGAVTFLFSPYILPVASIGGDPGMATAGSGDVLSGIIGALLARGMTPLSAACLGAYWHGRAGEIAAERLCSESLIASDLIDALPCAIVGELL